MAHLHSVYDSDTHFSINPVTRALKNESSKKSLVQYDHNSERFTFELPRYIEEHDMSLCDVIQVHYNNIDAQTREQNKGVYAVDDMQISPDGEDVVILSWLISGNATKFVGSLNFLIRFACTGDDGYVYYVWNTAIYSGISVSSGINNGEVIVDQYADILNQWKEELEGNQIVDLKQTQVGSGDGGVNVWTATFGDGRTSKFEVKNGSKGDPGTSVSVESISENTISGGSNVVIFTDGKRLTVKNGIDGADYVLTDADMDEIAALATIKISTEKVIGTIDENNDVILTGNLADGTYTLKYENEDGTYTEVGSLVIGAEPEPTYTNLIPLSTDASGNLYVGTNGEKGYKDGYKISVSTGNESAVEGIKCTGFIPVGYNDVLYFKGISFEASGSNTNYVVYNSNKSRLGGGNWYKEISGGVNGEVVSIAVSSLNPALGDVDANVAYIRISASVMDENSIITVNEPIE